MSLIVLRSKALDAQLVAQSSQLVGAKALYHMDFAMALLAEWRLATPGLTYNHSLFNISGWQWMGVNICFHTSSFLFVFVQVGEKERVREWERECVREWALMRDTERKRKRESRGKIERIDYGRTMMGISRLRSKKVLEVEGKKKFWIRSNYLREKQNQDAASTRLPTIVFFLEKLVL